jgi:hypothetical protein
MASGVGLRDDFDGGRLRRLARLSGHANQVRRLLALAVIYDGGATAVALIHNQLADEYEARASDVSGERPTLRIVGDAPSGDKGSGSVD